MLMTLGKYIGIYFIIIFHLMTFVSISCLTFWIYFVAPSSEVAVNAIAVTIPRLINA